MNHQIRLFFFKNGMLVLACSIMFFLITILALVAILVHATLKQTEQNEDLSRGISCILLIPPDERTKQNVSDCVEGNTKTKSNFEFKTEPEIKPNSKSMKQSTYKMQFNELSKESSSDIKPKSKSEPESKAPPIEQRTNPDGTTEYRYEGDTLWRSCTEDVCG